MNYSTEQLTGEVEQLFNESVASGRSIHVDWLANAVIAQHQSVEGDDKDFYVLCAWAHVKTAIRNIVRKSKPTDTGLSDIPQLILPGFDRLQTHYHIERDGEICVIRIDELTDEEIEYKITEYEAMAEGCTRRNSGAIRLNAHRDERHETGFQSWA